MHTSTLCTWPCLTTQPVPLPAVTLAPASRDDPACPLLLLCFSLQISPATPLCRPAHSAQPCRRVLYRRSTTPHPTACLPSPYPATSPAACACGNSARNQQQPGPAQGSSLHVHSSPIRDIRCAAIRAAIRCAAMQAVPRCSHHRSPHPTISPAFNPQF